MNYAEAEGRSIDDAIEIALARLGVTRDKVDIEIISNSTRGLFGLGGRRAKVRATLRRPLTLTTDAGGAAGDGAKAAAPAPLLAEAAASTARPAAATPTPRPQAPASTPRPAPSPTSASQDQSRASRPSRPRHPGPRPNKPSLETRPTAPQLAPRPAPPPLDSATIERGCSILGEIVRLTGSAATVTAAQEPDGVRLFISGDPSGVLIGRRGQTLDALEYLLNRIMAHEDEPISRFTVDLENYRQRRQQSLEALAQRAAERARRRGKPVTLNPMTPRDRRIVHLALQDDPTLVTRSAGSGFFRKVIIVPADAQRRRR